MQPPSILWPFPWWTALVSVMLLILVSWATAEALAGRRNRQMRRLSGELRDSGMSLGPATFAIGEGKNVLAIEGERLAVADLKNWYVVQFLSWAEAKGVKIYDNRSSMIEFCLLMNGGAQTRKFVTSSIAGFGRLFVLFANSGKSVQYIQS